MNLHDEVTLATALDIEDLFVMPHVGGRAERLARVQAAVIGAIERCTGTGEGGGAAVKPRTCPDLSSASASLDSDVGAAPAGEAERPPQPLPEPANSPSVQNEAEGNHGEDQPAQNEEALVPSPSARAASAECGKADPRNSSCEPAVVAGPGSQTDEPKPNLGRVVALDERLLRVIGFRGFFTTDRKIFDTISRLNDGEMHTIESLTKAGGWSIPPMFQTKLGLLGEKLDDIGITLTHIRGQGCNIARKIS